VAVLAKRGSFLSAVATGNQSVVDVGFTPKAVLLMTIGRAAVDEATHALLCIGAATGAAEEWAFYDRATNGQASTDCSTQIVTDGCIHVVQTGGTTIDAKADFVSFDADGFTINWSNAPPVGGFQIEYLALGGDGLEAFAGAESMTSSLGVASETGVGFQPKALLVMSNGQSVLTQVAANRFQMGMAVSPTERASMNFREDHSFANGAISSIQKDRLVCLTNGTPIVTTEIDLDSFDADGFTYDKTTMTAALILPYLALGGADLEVDFAALAQPVATGQQARSGLGFEPKVLIGLGGSDATGYDVSPSSTRDGRVAVGVRDDSSEACMWVGCEDVADPIDTDRVHTQSKFLTFRDNNRAVLAECDAVLDEDGYTLDWTTASATARQFFVLALGEVPEPEPPASGWVPPLRPGGRRHRKVRRIR
jgi:hypothetical protein